MPCFAPLTVTLWSLELLLGNLKPSELLEVKLNVAGPLTVTPLGTVIEATEYEPEH
jgi:hypothetical protein